MLECYIFMTINLQEDAPRAELLCFGARMEELGMVNQRREGSSETSEPLPEATEAPEELERDL